MTTIIRVMLFFSTKIKATESLNGSKITPISYNGGWLLPLTFARELKIEKIDFEQITIKEHAETPE